MECRAQKNCLYKCCFAIQKNNFFGFFINFVIITNTIVIAQDSYPEETEHERILQILNLIFSLIFIVEMCIKVAGVSWSYYFQDSYNCFDFCLVVASLIDFSLTNSDLNVKVLQVMRVVRVLRIFKLAKIWSGFNRILKIMQNTFSDMMYFGLLVYLFVLMYTLLGQSIFGYKIMFDKNNLPVPQELINNTTIEEL